MVKLKPSALVNTGFETDEPEVLLPASLAENLGLYPPTEGSKLEEYSVVGGITFVIRSPRTIRVKVVVEDRETEPVEAVPLISDKESEVLISDRLASELKISIEDPAEGTWRFRDEPLTKKRSSEEPKYWILS
ncbi:hypothetical protein KEJ25_07065 [Candidatus Bathyarchaeota archaeon]|nr:hypothetical protein [Candidatus Bathyarchaeota archaeon]